MSRPANCSTHALIEQLSPRQRDVLRLVARGLTNQEIGGVLRISSETVRTHVTALLTRLDVSNRTEAATAWAAWAAVAGLLEAGKVVVTTPHAALASLAARLSIPAVSPGPAIARNYLCRDEFQCRVQTHNGDARSASHSAFATCSAAATRSA